MPNYNVNGLDKLLSKRLRDKRIVDNIVETGFAATE